MTLTDRLAIIDVNLDDATLYGDPAAVAEVRASLAATAIDLAPLVEVLSHPENREHLARWQAWMEKNGPHTGEQPAEVDALLTTLAAVLEL